MKEYRDTLQARIEANVLKSSPNLDTEQLIGMVALHECVFYEEAKIRVMQAIGTLKSTERS